MSALHLARTAVLSATCSLAAYALPGDPCLEVSHCHFSPWLQDGSSIGSGLGYAVDLQRGTAVVGSIGRNSVYVYELREGQWLRTQIITGPSGSFFGAAVELDGDRLLVGAPRFDGQEVDEGRAFLYERRNGPWALTQSFAPSLAFDSGLFGTSVSMDEDWLAIGEPGAPEGGVSTYRLGTEFEFMGTLRGTEGNSFGHAVAVQDERLVVGDPHDDDLGLNAGAAYHYFLNHAGHVELSKFIPAAVGPLDFFGTALALDEGRLAVSATGDDTALDNAGAVYLFGLELLDVFPFEVYDEIDFLTPCSSYVSQRFGDSLDLAGGRLAVGSSSPGFALASPGTVAIFERRIFPAESWNFEQRLGSPVLQPGDQFGHGVAIEGERVLVGARASNLAAQDSGAAFFFSTSNSQPGGACPCDVLANSKSYGQALPGTAGEPELKLNSPPVLGESVLVGLRHLEPGSQPYLWISPSPSTAPFDPRRPLVPGSGFLAFPTVTNFGQVGLQWDVPADLSLCGSEWHMLAFLPDPGAPGPLHLAVSNSLRLRLGY